MPVFDNAKKKKQLTPEQVKAEYEKLHRSLTEELIGLYLLEEGATDVGTLRRTPIDPEDIAELADHRSAWTAIQDLLDQGVPPTPRKVAERMANVQAITTAQINEAEATLEKWRTERALDIPWVIRKLEQISGNLLAVRTYENVATMIYNPAERPENKAGAFFEAAQSLMLRNIEDQRDLDLRGIINEGLATSAEFARLKREGGQMFGFPPAYGDLADVPILPQNLVSVIGQAGTGKTMIALDVALHNAQNNQVLLVLAETDTLTITARLLSRYSGMAMRSVFSGAEEVDPLVKKRVDNSLALIPDGNLHVVFAPGITPAQLHNLVAIHSRRAEERFGTRHRFMFIVDYVGAMGVDQASSDGKRRSWDDRTILDDRIDTLKWLTDTYQCAGFLLEQMNYNEMSARGSKRLNHRSQIMLAIHKREVAEEDFEYINERGEHVHRCPKHGAVIPAAGKLCPHCKGEGKNQLTESLYLVVEGQEHPGAWWEMIKANHVPKGKKYPMMMDSIAMTWRSCKPSFIPKHKKKKRGSDNE